MCSWECLMCGHQSTVSKASSPLPPCGFQGKSSGHQGWQKQQCLYRLSSLADSEFLIHLCACSCVCVVCLQCWDWTQSIYQQAMCSLSLHCTHARLHEILLPLPPELWGFSIDGFLDYCTTLKDESRHMTELKHLGCYWELRLKNCLWVGSFRLQCFVCFCFPSVVSYDLVLWPCSSWTQFLTWEAWMWGARCTMLHAEGAAFAFQLTGTSAGGKTMGTRICNPPPKSASLGTKSVLLHLKILCWLISFQLWFPKCNLNWPAVKS